ncbi:MAG: hypothetical protein ACFFAS_15405 [Promethearchaeota archaeon]
MARQPRKAPSRKKDPLDEYSTWDVRAARVFYYSFILATVIFVLGMWITFLTYLADSGGLDWFLRQDPSLIAGIIGGIFTGHAVLLVFFYALFRGGIYRLCKILFPDRKIAKKYEDYNVLRGLLAATILGIYFTVFAMIIFFLPPEFYDWAWGVWIDWAKAFTFGIWILWFSTMMFLSILFILVAFILWSHGVYAVLKRVKRIDEEIEIDEEIKTEQLKEMNEEELQKAYKKMTGKKALYRGKETKAYAAWKKENVGK